MTRVPAGYLWSFSGDATLPDLMSSIAGQVSSVGSVSGRVGLIGVVGGGSSSGGVSVGRVRIREDDDLEVLQLLGIV